MEFGLNIQYIQYTGHKNMQFLSVAFSHIC